MYNRYIRNDNGSYSRIPQEEDRQPLPHPSQHRLPGSEPSGQQPNRPRPDTAPSFSAQKGHSGFSGLLRHLLDQLHLDHVDTGDLLLLGLLFLLLREDADEELLVALGLLLIL